MEFELLVPPIDGEGGLELFKAYELILLFTKSIRGKRIRAKIA